MTPWARLRAYAAHDDPATAMANSVALIVGWNTPFYPLYVMYVADRPAAPALLTAASTPFFLAVPALARRSSRSARAGLPVIGTLNTLWCIKVLGADCGLQVFLLPCVLLAGLLHRPGERPLLLAAACLAVAANFVPAGLFGALLLPLSAAASHGLARLNACSALFLCVVLAVQLAAVVRAGGDASGPGRRRAATLTPILSRREREK